MSLKDDDLPFPEFDKKEITLFSGNITKSEIKEKAEIAINTVNDGHIDPIDMFIKTRALKEVCDEILDNIKDKVSDKLISIHKQDRKFRGVELQLNEGGTRYSFEHSLKWRSLKDSLDETSAKLKSFEKLMIASINEEIYDADGVMVDEAVIIGGTSPVLKVVIPK